MIKFYPFLMIGLLGGIGLYFDSGKGIVWRAYGSSRQLSFSF